MVQCRIRTGIHIINGRKTIIRHPGNQIGIMVTTNLTNPSQQIGEIKIHGNLLHPHGVIANLPFQPHHGKTQQTINRWDYPSPKSFSSRNNFWMNVLSKASNWNVTLRAQHGPENKDLPAVQWTGSHCPTSRTEVGTSKVFDICLMDASLVLYSQKTSPRVFSFPRCWQNYEGLTST